MLSFSGFQGTVVSRQRCRGRGQTALKVRLLAKSFQRRQVRPIRGTGTQPRPAPTIGEAEFIRFVVLVGSGQPKGSDGTHHQPRVDLAKPIVVNPQLGHLYWRVVVNEKISPGNEAGKFFLFLTQIQRDPTLIGIQREKEPAFLRIDDLTRKRTTLASPVA